VNNRDDARLVDARTSLRRFIVGPGTVEEKSRIFRPLLAEFFLALEAVHPSAVVAAAAG
jgi:hypothetical protein